MVSEAVPLTTQLREATASLHREAERSGVVRELLTGGATRAGLTALLYNLLPVYTALETGLELRRQEALFSHLARPELYRSGSLRHDLSQLGADPIFLPEGATYVARVEAGATGDGTELVAFAYVRYIGDLSGGQILSQLIGRSLGLHSLSFYQFPEIGDVGAFRDAYRRAIDEFGARVTDTAKIVGAAQDAFRLDILLSKAVARMLYST